MIKKLIKKINKKVMIIALIALVIVVIFGVVFIKKITNNNKTGNQSAHYDTIISDNTTKDETDSDVAKKEVETTEEETTTNVETTEEQTEAHTENNVVEDEPEPQVTPETNPPVVIENNDSYNREEEIWNGIPVINRGYSCNSYSIDELPELPAGYHWEEDDGFYCAKRDRLEYFYYNNGELDLNESFYYNEKGNDLFVKFITEISKTNKFINFLKENDLYDYSTVGGQLISTSEIVKADMITYRVYNKYNTIVYFGFNGLDFYLK